jgi:trehalose 6-phosphate phosphatase
VIVGRAIVNEFIANDAAGDLANKQALEIFGRLDPASVAFLLDVDGTLVDIGPSPFEVDVPDSLKQILERLYRLSGGALALVSGRPIRDIDKLFAPLKLPAVGGHGAELRIADSAPVSRVGDFPAAMRRRLIEAAIPDSGVVFEDKGYSVALHYRQAPHQEERLRAHIAATRAAFPEVETEVLPGKAMFEVKRPGVDKGDGVRAVMAQAPFAGRMPVFIGDDVTDEAAFAAMTAFGGKGFSVGSKFGGVAGVFSSPEQVRQALWRLTRV